MSDLKLGYGCNKALPEEVTTAWGARWIYPNDVVWNRQDLKGPNSEALKNWLNAGALNAARIEATRLAKSWQMFQDKDYTYVLHSDDDGMIVGNPQGSYGYLYVAGWLHTDAPLHVVVESHWRDERWEGEIPGPPPGQTTLEYLFRFFIVVDEGDREKLLSIGYTLPSLSVDDHVTVFGKRWRCENTGWELADDDGRPTDA